MNDATVNCVQNNFSQKPSEKAKNKHTGEKVYGRINKRTNVQNSKNKNKKQKQNMKLKINHRNEI